VRRPFTWLLVGFPSALLLALAIFSQTSLGGYLLSGAIGHARILTSRESISWLLASDKLDVQTHAKLELVAQVRAFAATSLGLPQGDSYAHLARIDREHAGWNVYAAPMLSTRARLWCFPLVGCVVYRGYFSRHEARAFAGKIAAEEQLDTWVAPFSGYSSLGYLPDPLLSTQLALPPARLAALVIHELAHQRLYLPGRSKINEAFARLVEREGLKRWLRERGEYDHLAQMQHRWRESERRARLAIAARDRLEKLYASELTHKRKLAHKSELLLELQQRLCGKDCAHLTTTSMNNAALIPYTTYNEELASMYQLFALAGEDFARFYQLVEENY